jgi:hypothetical protein
LYRSAKLPPILVNVNLSAIGSSVPATITLLSMRAAPEGFAATAKGHSGDFLLKQPLKSRGTVRLPDPRTDWNCAPDANVCAVNCFAKHSSSHVVSLRMRRGVALWRRIWKGGPASPPLAMKERSRSKSRRFAFLTMILPPGTVPSGDSASRYGP